MPENTQYDLTLTQINFASETLSVAHGSGGKSALAPIEHRRHIYSETINTQDANARLLLETNSNQAFICDFIVNAGTLNYKIEVVQRSSNISVSSIQSQVLSGARVIYSFVSTSPLLNDVYVPPDSLLYIVGFNSISSVLVSARPYYTRGIEKVNA